MPAGYVWQDVRAEGRTTHLRHDACLAMSNASTLQIERHITPRRLCLQKNGTHRIVNLLQHALRGDTPPQATTPGQVPLCLQGTYMLVRYSRER